MKYLFLLSSAALAATPLAAQETAQETAQEIAPEPLQVSKVDSVPSGNAILPANTEIVLEMTQEITTKGKAWSEGDKFKLSVSDDVMLGEYVVIPRGTPGYGTIKWLTSKGMFGKSGKMDIELEYIELNNRRVKIDGTYRQDGEGNTLATVGGVVLAGPFAAFITGKSGRIPQGRELKATLEDPIELAIPASAVYQSKEIAPILAPNAASVAVQPPSAPQAVETVEGVEAVEDAAVSN